METEAILRSRIEELEDKVLKLKCENARLRCRLLALISEHDILLPEDSLNDVDGLSSGLKINEKDE